MKTALGLLLAALSLLLLGGCNKPASNTDSNTIDTADLERKFNSADPDQKASVKDIVEKVRAKDYDGAKAELKRLTASAKLTPEQRQSIEGTFKQLGGEIKETAKKVADDAKEGFNKAFNKEPAK